MRIFEWLKNSPIFIKIALVLVVVGLGWFTFFKIKSSSAQPTYLTATVTKGTIIVSVTASGVVSTANSVQVNTAASGVVSNIYKTNGQQVNAGDPIALLTLDLQGQQRALSAWSTYQSAKDALYSLQSSMLTSWKTYMDSATSGTYQNSDQTPNIANRQLPQFVSTYDDWLSSQAKYVNQQNTINQDWYSYQLSSPTVYAPISGTLTGFGLQIGSVITAQSNSSGGSSVQKIASVVTDATPTVTVNLTEIDEPKVKVGDKTTVTFDAFPGKTFTGKVISIDTVGAVSSGVTTYPAVIKLDTESKDILTNMSAEAEIITNVKDNVLIVPSEAVKSQTVTVLKNNVPQLVDVTTGLVSNTDTEIITGLSEGETVVTSTVNPTAISGSTSSPFGGLGGNRGFGGGAVRIRGG